MKEIYMEKEDAVSPVIATILMVAITVVLAATVYILVSHYTSVGATTPLTASLAVDNEGQSGKIYFYNLTITVSTPANLTNIANVHIVANTHAVALATNSNLQSVMSAVSAAPSGTGSQYLIYNTNGVLVNSYIQSGSTIVVVSNSNLSGDTVSLTYSGYSGTVSTTLP
jgi:flagellin-like protein